MEKKKRKEYSLPEHVLRIMEEVRREHHFTTDTDTLVFIIGEYDKNRCRVIPPAEREEIVGEIAERVRYAFQSQIDRVRFASAKTEKQTYIIQDAINTMLYETNASFLMKASGETRHQVIRESEANYTKELDYMKKCNDNRKAKNRSSSSEIKK